MLGVLEWIEQHLALVIGVTGGLGTLLAFFRKQIVAHWKARFDRKKIVADTAVMEVETAKTETTEWLEIFKQLKAEVLVLNKESSELRDKVRDHERRIRQFERDNAQLKRQLEKEIVEREYWKSEAEHQQETNQQHQLRIQELEQQNGHDHP